jgi:hypothetical protein
MTAARRRCSLAKPDSPDLLLGSYRRFGQPKGRRRCPTNLAHWLANPGPSTHQQAAQIDS